MAVKDPDEFIPTRKTLLSRLKDVGDKDSWQDFFDTYWKLIYSTALRAGLTEAEAQDVVQETVIAAAKSLPGFKYDPAIGSFKAWLLNLTRWRIADQWRQRPPAGLVSRGQPGSDGETGLIERVPDPTGSGLERMWDEEWEKNLVGAAIERVKRQVDPKQYQLFDLHVLKEWPVAKVARTLKVTATGVYLAKHRISKMVKKETERLREKAN